MILSFLNCTEKPVRSSTVDGWSPGLTLPHQSQAEKHQHWMNRAKRTVLCFHHCHRWQAPSLFVSQSTSYTKSFINFNLLFGLLMGYRDKIETTETQVSLAHSSPLELMGWVNLNFPGSRYWPWVFNVYVGVFHKWECSMQGSKGTVSRCMKAGLALRNLFE